MTRAEAETAGSAIGPDSTEVRMNACTHACVGDATRAMRGTREGWMKKKETGSIGVSVSRVGLARAETRGTTRVVGWMDG